MKNRKRILAAILTAIMTISILPANSFASEAGENDTAEAAVEAVSVSDEEQEVESTVEDISEETTEEKEEVSSETVEAEEETGPAEEAEAVTEDVETAAEEDAEAEETFEDEIPEEEEAVPAETVEWPITLQAKSGTYNVTVTYGEDAGLPADAKVSVDEITASDRVYDDYVEQAADTISADVDDLAYAKLFDIKLIDADGNKLEPTGFVDVKIRLKDVGQVEESTQVVHFAGDAEVPEVLDTDVSGKDVSFETDGFSVYAVIGTGDFERLTVNFYGAKSGDDYTLVDTMYVKKKDQESQERINQIIYDPGAGTIPAGYAFYGWSIDNPNYSVESTGKTIDEVRTYIKGLEFADGEVLNIYAMLVTYYKIDYIDPDGVSLGSDKVMVQTKGDNAEYQINMHYSTDNFHNFEGWLVADGISNIVEPAGTTATDVLPNHTNIVIKGNVKFSVSAPAGHWLIFDENGKHATYNAPRFVKAGEVTSGENLLEMKRPGYTFDDWYTTATADPGTNFTFGQPLSETTTIYANWIPNARADYTVIIWKEGLTAGTWDFEESITLNGNVGSTINTVVPQGSTTQDNGRGRYATVNGVEKKYTGFRYDHHDTGVTINAEGNALVNVYFVRNTYTLRFWVTTYGLGIPLRELDPITAKYGYDISSHFPMKASLLDWPSWFDVGSVVSQYVRWNPQSDTVFTQPLVYIETMPAGDVTFYADRSGVDPKAMYYYIEALPGERVDRTFNGKDFILYEGPLYARYNYFTEKEDYKEIPGCVKFGTEPTFGSNGQTATTVNTLRCYYTRQTKLINYQNGAYFDGNNIRTDFGSEYLGQSEPILFASDISSYNKGGENFYEPASPEDGYVLEGWYADKACTQPYTFNRMPASDITVYAKWRQIEYRVFLRPNAGTDPTLTWGSGNQETNFRVAYDGKISAPEGQRTGYRFYGWFFDEELENGAYLPGFRLNETTVSDTYDKTAQENMTDPSDAWGNANATSNADVDRFWITKRFELFAKWGKVVTGAEGIGIYYNANGGSGAPSDNVLYQDNTKAVAGAAPTAPAGKVFKNWAVQKWDGEKYVDSGVYVLPGQTFDVIADDAKIVDNNTGAIIPIADAVSSGSYTYTIQLNAEYVDKEDEVPTHITWYKNDGTGAVLHENTDIKINEAVPVYGLGEGEIPTRTGYTFLGWAKDKEREDAQADPNTSTTKTTADFLEYKDGNFYLPGTTTVITEVAADEVTPYEALYAIWEESFKIYHSATGDTETIRMSKFDGDITKKVTNGYLYGGYYEFEEDGDHKGKACTVSGLSMTPEAGTTYYLREVDPDYLKPSVYLIYSNYYNGKIQDLYGFVNVDNEAEYKDVGMFVNGTKMTVKDTLATQAIYITRGGADYATLDSSNLFGMPGATFGYKKLNNDLIAGDTTVRIGGYYVTKDNVQVTGYRDRMIRFAANDERYDAPIFTGWYPEGNTRIGLKTVGTTNTLAVVTSARPLFARRTLTINAPSEKMEYTITKIYDNVTDEEVVEEGDYTGVISYASRSGYLFAGWYKDAAFTEPADFSAVSSDMTVYAKYVKNSDVSVAFTSKSLKSRTATLNATVTVKGQADFENVTVSTKGTSTSVLTGRTVKKTGSGKNVKYTTQYKGTATVKGVSLISSFTASVNWTTPDGTAVTGPAYNCNYILGLVTVN